MARRRTGYWALAATPKSYRVEDAIQQLPKDSWITTGKPIRAGDRAVIWKCKGDEDKRGVVALAEVLTDPEHCSVPRNPYRIDPMERSEAQWRVNVRYVTFPRLPIWCEENPESVVNRLSVKRACGGTVFYVEPDEWRALLQEAGGWPE